MRRILNPLLLVLVPILAIVAACSSDRSEEPPMPTREDVVTLFRSGDAAGARLALEQIVAANPEDVDSWQLLGTARQQLGDSEAAIEAFQRTLSLDPTRAPARYGLAQLVAASGDLEKAIQELEKLAAERSYDLSQLGLDPVFSQHLDEPRIAALLPTEKDFRSPFVEPARILHEWRGESSGDEFGWIARNVGDVDGDGADDVVTSAPQKAIDGAAAGRVYVYSSRSGQLLWQASGQPGDTLGLGVEAAGDVDGDGSPDVVAGAPGGNRVVVYRGRDGEILLELAALQNGESFGRDVVGVGDVDGDGHGDLLVGSPLYDGPDPANPTTDAGRVAVYSGRDGSILHQWLGEPGSRLGAAVAGEWNGDGGHFLLGAPDAGPGRRGAVLVFRGLDQEPALRIDSDGSGSELGGMFLSVIGDVDGDGASDLYASDWAHGENGPTTGKIVVHSGADGSELLAVAGEAAGDGFGIGPADAGDVDGDGHDDLVVGAWQHSSSAPRGGKVYLYSGRDGSLIRAWTGNVMGDTFGFDATGMGDVDGDGTVDLLLTSAWSAVEGPKTGRVFLISSGS